MGDFTKEDRPVDIKNQEVELDDVSRSVRPISELTETFIVRLWMEVDGRLWRGHITHISSGKKVYFQDLSDMQAFIKTYLDAMFNKPSFFTRLRIRFQRWLKQRGAQ